MQQDKTRSLPTRQHGMALAITLILLIGITALSLVSINAGLLEVIMSGNAEARVSAFQRAEAGVDALTAMPANFKVQDGAGVAYCTPGYTAKYPGEPCTDTSLTLADSFDADKTEIRLVRINPAVLDCPPVRSIGTDCESGNYASFAADSRYDDRAARGGRAQHVQGFLRLLPNPGETRTFTGFDPTDSGRTTR